MKNDSEIPLCGLVLAGGRSSRMGSDKAALVHADGRPLARRCHDLLRDAGCGKVVISLRHGQEIPSGFSGIEDLAIVRDPADSAAGPLTGIVSGMRTRPEAAWLVVACDLPQLDLKTLTQLVAENQPGEIFLAYRSESDGLPEPLCALYSPAALAVLERSMDEHFRSPRRSMLESGCRLLDPVTPHALDNANTPADWAACQDESPPEWRAGLLEIWISEGNDFRGRHGLGRLEHGILGVPEVECVAGMGLRGDRYFSHKPDFKGQVTFFDAAAVQAVRDHFLLPELSGSVFRRNLIVRGVDLREWVGTRFRFQGVDFEASEECRPCYWMDETVAPGVEEFLRENFRGGLRARILSDGILRVGG